MTISQLSHLLAIGAAINLLAPVASARLGDSLGRTMPFVLGFTALAASCFLVTAHWSLPTYIAGVIGLSFATIFLGPFVLGGLSRLDPSGRLAAVAPAFFMIGLATGPALGAFVLSTRGLSGLGVFGVVAAIVALALFIGAQAKTFTTQLVT
jgi:predicted MFS family arabinose efflux permease